MEPIGNKNSLLSGNDNCRPSFNMFSSKLIDRINYSSILQDLHNSRIQDADTDIEFYGGFLATKTSFLNQSSITWFFVNKRQTLKDNNTKITVIRYAEQAIVFIVEQCDLSLIMTAQQFLQLIELTGHYVKVKLIVNWVDTQIHMQLRYIIKGQDESDTCVYLTSLCTVCSICNHHFQHTLHQVLEFHSLL